LAMAQMRSHSSSAMGKIDGRDCRMGARLSNRGSAFTSARVIATMPTIRFHSPSDRKDFVAFSFAFMLSAAW
jgi:hypothetical protein